GQLTRLIRKDDQPVAIQGESRDVTEQRRTAAALAQSEARLRAIVECLGEGLIVTDRDDRVLYVNPAFEQITGYGAEDLIGNRAFDLVAATGRLRGPRGGEGGSDTHPLAERYELRIRHR